MYNVLFYQIVTQLSATLTDMECNKIVAAFSDYETVGVKHVGHALALVLSNLDKCSHIRKESVDETISAAARNNDPVDLKFIESEVQKLSLPFLRVAALLRHHIYHQELPHVAATHLEFARLVYFLELVTLSMDWNIFDSTKALCFIPSMDIALPKQWCAELKEVSPPHHITRDLVIHQHINWQQPRLLRLPREYEKLFTVRDVFHRFSMRSLRAKFFNLRQLFNFCARKLKRSKNYIESFPYNPVFLLKINPSPSKL